MRRPNLHITGARMREISAIGLVLALLSGCGFDFSLLPTANEPYRDELAAWQREQLLEAPLGALPEEIADGLSSEHVRDASRFLTRVLETAPDGEERRWQSLDRNAVLEIRMLSTAANGETVCRLAVLSLETAASRQDHDLRACRLRNGTWRK